jgi:hypothetical protein
MSIKAAFPSPTSELFGHHLSEFKHDKNTQTMWWFSIMNDSMCRYKDSRRYAEEWWRYTGK